MALLLWLFDKRRFDSAVAKAAQLTIVSLILVATHCGHDIIDDRGFGDGNPASVDNRFCAARMGSVAAGPAAGRRRVFPTLLPIFTLPIFTPCV